MGNLQDALFVNKGAGRQQIGETLYNLDSKGKLRVWQIFVEDNGSSAAIIMVAGLADGKRAENISTVSTGKNTGKANETSCLSQAIAEAQSKILKQFKLGYVNDSKKAKQGTSGSGIAKPMLAHKYHPEGKAHEGTHKNLKEMGILGKEIDVQPKYDGLRCLARLTPDTVELFHARKGDPMQPIPHLIEELKKAIAKFPWYDLSELVIDGELFTDKFSFNKLNGLLKKEKKTAEDLELLSHVHYRLFDAQIDFNYRERYEVLANFESESIIRVPTFTIIAEPDLIEAKLNEFLAEGHEGLMGRQLDMPYESKRTWQLWKRKLPEDKEFRLVDIERSAAGHLGAFKMEMDCIAHDRDGKLLRTFNAGIKDIDQETGAKIMKNPIEFIGKMATVRFFGRSEYSVPRFPKVKAFRDDDESNED